MNELQSTYGPLLLRASFDHDIATHDQIPPSTPRVELYKKCATITFLGTTYLLCQTTPSDPTLPSSFHSLPMSFSLLIFLYVI